MVGLERSTLPLIGREDFGLDLERRGAVVHRRLRAGQGAHQPRPPARWPQRVGRRRLLIAGWAVALPVPLLIAVAPSWGWIVAANVLLGVNQGLAWSMTVVMKIDLVGPKRRGLALGLNEAAGYGGVALAAGLSGWLAADVRRTRRARRRRRRHRRGGVPAARCCSSATPPRTSRSSRPRHHHDADGRPPTLRDAFAQATYREPTLRSCSQAGLVNNLNDAPRLGARAALPRRPRRRASAEIGLVAALYPGGLERRADRHRSLVRHRRPQAADRRRHARPGRARWRCWPSATARSRSPPRPRCCSASGPRWSTRR